uniref:Odorant binding protein 2 n=1 Tax=Cyrtorhinus lividipennis TaxID=1032904 RepID=A0A1W6AWI1_9HEMI|nr:odorant binding protein 2 [Cyrtorhinus lividipennis]
MARRILTCPILHLLLMVISFALFRHVEPKMLTDEQKEQLMSDIKECMNETGITDDEFVAIATRQEPPTSEQGKCFLNCAMEKMEIMADGTLNVVAIQASLEEQIEDKTKLEMTKTAVKECSETVKAEGKCEYAAAASECLVTKYKEIGLTENFMGS